MIEHESIYKEGKDEDEQQKLSRREEEGIDISQPTKQCQARKDDIKSLGKEHLLYI